MNWEGFGVISLSILLITAVIGWEIWKHRRGLRECGCRWVDGRPIHKCETHVAQDIRRQRWGGRDVELKG